MKVEIKHITKKYSELAAVNDVSLEINQGELLALLGPSGCGKTTLLRVIAGLIEHEEGTIIVKGKDITNLPPQKRNAALVFQSYALFPHMNVAENIAYGLRHKGLSKQAIHEKLTAISATVELEGYLQRQIHELSGGQQQRVALARALILEPDILLFDEPLSNLDEKLRVNMRQEIKRIQSQLNITSIYVTHDQKEALSIADKIAVMNQGIIEQIGSPDELYHHPTNTFVANFIGNANLIEPEIVHHNGSQYTVKLLGRTIEVVSKSKCFQCLVRPEEIYPDPNSTTRVRIQWVENLGNILRYTLVHENDRLFMDRLNRMDTENYAIDDVITITFNQEAVKTVDVRLNSNQ